MPKMYSEELKQKIVNEINEGKSVFQISVETKIAQSTLYEWRNNYSKRFLSNGRYYSQKEIDLLKIRNKKLEEMFEIFNVCLCSPYSPLNEKLIAIKNNLNKYSVHSMCTALKVRRSTFYYYLLRRPQKTSYQLNDELLKPKIKEIFEKSKARYGAVRIQVVLKKQNINVATKKISQLMKEMDIRVCFKKQHIEPKEQTPKYYVNKLKQKFNQAEPNAAWVSDITYIKVNDKFYYLCVIIDLFSRKVIAYKISKNIDANLTNETFIEAYSIRNRPENLMFHSDQGSVYTDFYFRKLLRSLKIKQSFSRIAYPYDNAVMESFFGAIKKEELSRQPYYSLEELVEAVDEYMIFYNSERPHYSLGYRSPDEYEEIYYNNINNVKIYK